MLDVVRDKRKILKKEGKIKNEKYRKSQTTAINIFTFTFCIEKIVFRSKT